MEILTRCYKRPTMLAANMASLDRQSSRDWVQTFLTDEVGRGVPWANRNLGEYAPHLEGDYIWVLDDDDECISDTFVEDIREIVALHNPEVVIVRGDYGSDGVLPEAGNWERAPVFTHIGMSSFVVRRSAWQRYASSFHEALGADFAFISAVWKGLGPAAFYWHWQVVVRSQRRSDGAPE